MNADATARSFTAVNAIWTGLTAAQRDDQRLVASLLTRKEIEQLVSFAECRGDRADAMDLRFHL